jgi:2'-5' RNA ligase
MKKIRTFAAIDIPPFVKDFIGEFIKHIRGRRRGIKWVNTDNLHITLKFIGEHDEELTQAVESALTPIAAAATPFEITISHMGAFPDRNNPRIIWQKIETRPPLSLLNLHSSIEAALEPLGIEREKRKFSSHLTIGRIKQPSDLEGLWAYEQQHPFPPISFEAESFSLYRSVLKPKGAQYTVLKNYSLQ